MLLKAKFIIYAALLNHISFTLVTENKTANVKFLPNINSHFINLLPEIIVTLMCY